VAGSPLREVRALAVFALGQSTAAAPALVAPVRKTAAPGHIRVQLGVGGGGRLVWCGQLESVRNTVSAYHTALNPTCMRAECCMHAWWCWYRGALYIVGMPPSPPPPLAPHPAQQLAAALRDPSGFVRATAAAALGFLGRRPAPRARPHRRFALSCVVHFIADLLKGSVPETFCHS
jgi:hypothetical protein